MSFFTFNDKSTEETKEIVMDKTVSVSTNDTEGKIKVDHLDKNETVEKDVLKARQAENDAKGTTALPLFRFEEKQKKELINLVKIFLEAANKIKKESLDKYSEIYQYMEIPKISEVDYLFNLAISRNKELYKSSPKELKIELISCYYEKKVRMKLGLSETDSIENNIEYETEINKIRKIFNSFFDECALITDINKKEKNTTFVVDESDGDYDYGSGVSIYILYDKMIDYMNARRGKEDYEDYFSALDEEFAHNIEEQNNVKGSEAIADGMSEDSEESNDTEEGGENEFEGDDLGSDDESFEEGDDFGGETDDEEGTSDFGDSDSSSDSSSSGVKIKPGENPLSDINSKEKIGSEIENLKIQIEKTLNKLENFKSNSVVKKLFDLKKVVIDALKCVYIVPVEDSMLRYSIYLNRFEELISILRNSL